MPASRYQLSIGPSPIQQPSIANRQAKNIDSFKRLLKTYLFSQAFCEEQMYIFYWIGIYIYI